MCILWKCKSAPPYYVVSLTLTLDLLNPKPKIIRVQHTVEYYYCAKFQVIPVMGFRFIVLKHTHAHTHIVTK